MCLLSFTNSRFIMEFTASNSCTILPEDERSKGLKFVKMATRVEVFRRVGLAKDYIIGHHDKKIKLQDVALSCCLSVNHLLRNFKQVYGVSPHKYLMLVRLQRAKLLLETTTYSVNEISMLVGFECTSSFIRLFKQYFHYTPIAFKKQMVPLI